MTLGSLSAAIVPPASTESGVPSVDESHATVTLETVTVFSSRVALQEPSSTFAAPISALRYEPQVDVQTRSFAEGQADVTIRGGTFENTGFRIGALPVYDPQTGHYSAELPVSAYMLGVPDVRVGADLSQSGFNATAGSVAYGWRPIRTGGAVSVGGGEKDLARGEVYVGVVCPEKIAGFTVGADVSVAASQGDGPRTGSDHDYARHNARIQISNTVGRTDVFVGYQSKNFAWPNLYAARNQSTPLRDERERLQTKLFLVHNRTELGADGDYVQAGAYYRGNRDHYSIPDFGAAGDFHHQTVVRGAAVEGRGTVVGRTALRYSAGVVDDDLDSTSLTFGRFMSRTQTYGSLAAEQTVELGERDEMVLLGGARYDDSNRDGSEVSPFASIELRRSGGGALRRVYASYAETTQLPTYQALNAAPGGLFGGDPDLARAVATNYELGAEFAFGGWTFTPAVFFRKDDKLLDHVFDPSNPLSSRVARTVDLETIGVELFVRRSWARFDLIAGYSFLDKSDDYTSPNVASFYALNYAEHRLTVAGVARLGGGFEVRMDNELRRQADNALRQEGRDNVDTAIGLFYHVPGVKGLVLNAQVENLWDTAFQDVPLVPHTPRTWSVGATYVW